MRDPLRGGDARLHGRAQTPCANTALLSRSLTASFGLPASIGGKRILPCRRFILAAFLETPLEPPSCVIPGQGGGVPLGGATGCRQRAETFEERPHVRAWDNGASTPAVAIAACSHNGEHLPLPARLIGRSPALRGPVSATEVCCKGADLHARKAATAHPERLSGSECRESLLAHNRRLRDTSTVCCA